MGTIECSQPASKSSSDSQDFGDISMVLKMAHFHKSTGPRWVNTILAKSYGCFLFFVCFLWIIFHISFPHRNTIFAVVN